MKIVKTVAIWLLIIGGLNWGLTAFNFNVVDMIFGAGSTLSMLIYILIGLSALVKLWAMFMKPKNNMMQSSGGM